MGRLHFLRRPVAVVLVAAAFGVAVAVLKGGDAGVRDALGNISAPWLLLPFLAGTLVRGPLRGALIGVTTCLAALTGFYVAEAFVLDLGGHPLLTNLALTLGAGRMYFVAGMLSGPLFGGLGGICTRHRRAMMAVVVGLALAGEPFAVFAWLSREGMAPADTGLVVQYPALWVGEMALGVLLAGMVASGGLRLGWKETRRLRH
jgi:hypothetical protein